MDGQNANGGGYPQNQNPQQAPQQPPVKKPFFGFGKQESASYTNLRTSSMIMTERDNVQQQLDEMRAQNLAAAREEMRQANMQKAAHHTVRAVIVIIIVVAIILVLVLGFFILDGMGLFRPARGGNGGDDPGTQLPTDPDDDDVMIGGYKCKNSDCAESADLGDGRKIIRDGKYYILDTDTNVALLTTIPEKSYREINIVTWGEKMLAILYPEDVSKQGVYSISENRALVDFKYDSYITDPQDAAYADQEDIVGEFIIAKNGSDLRMVYLNDGKETVHGAKRVFRHGSFFIGTEEDGRKYVYVNGMQFLVTDAEDELIYHNPSGYLIYLRGHGGTYSMQAVYDPTSKRVSDPKKDEYYKTLEEMIRHNSGSNAKLLTELFSGDDFYTIPD